MISNVGSAKRPLRLELKRECGLPAVAYCQKCDRNVCSAHLYARHYLRHPVIYLE